MGKKNKRTKQQNMKKQKSCPQITDGATGGIQNIDDATGYLQNTDGATGCLQNTDGATGGIQNIDDATGYLQNTDGATGCLQNTDGATGDIQNIDDATGYLQNTDGATGCLQNTDGATGGIQNIDDATGGLQYTDGATGGLQYIDGATGGLQYIDSATGALQDFGVDIRDPQYFYGDNGDLQNFGGDNGDLQNFGGDNGDLQNFGGDNGDLQKTYDDINKTPPVSNYHIKCMYEKHAQESKQLSTNNSSEGLSHASMQDKDTKTCKQMGPRPKTNYISKSRERPISLRKKIPTTPFLGRNTFSPFDTEDEDSKMIYKVNSQKPQDEENINVQDLASEDQSKEQSHAAKHTGNNSYDIASNFQNNKIDTKSPVPCTENNDENKIPLQNYEHTTSQVTDHYKHESSYKDKRDTENKPSTTVITYHKHPPTGAKGENKPKQCHKGQSREFKSRINKFSSSSKLFIQQIFKGEAFDNKKILVIVPIVKNKLWIAWENEPHMTLVKINSGIVKKSVNLAFYGQQFIADAKKWNDGLLVICFPGTEIFWLSDDGNKRSIFFNCRSYGNTLGLYVTADKNVIVGLGCTNGLQQNTFQNKLLRIRSDGNRLQVISIANEGFDLPFSLLAQSTGQVIVVDWGQGIKCVNPSDGVVSPWNGDVAEIMRPTAVTSFGGAIFVTDYKNHKVFVMKENGAEARCLLDKSHGIQYPFSVAVDPSGWLFVGCRGFIFRCLWFVSDNPKTNGNNPETNEELDQNWRKSGRRTAALFHQN